MPDFALLSVLIVVYGIGVGYIIYFRYQLKISAEKVEREGGITYQSLCQQNSWKKSQPLLKNTRDYKMIHWLAIIIPSLFGLTVIGTLLIDRLGVSFFINANMFLLYTLPLFTTKAYFYFFQDGVIINGVCYAWEKLESVQVEKITKWHPLYGLNKDINDGYRIVIHVKRKFFNKHYMIVTDQEEKDDIIKRIEKQQIGVSYTENVDYNTYFVP